MAKAAAALYMGQPNLSKAIKEILVYSKYEVDTAYDGLDALDYVDQYSYDLIIMDVMMPKMNGIEALKRIRAKKIDTPIIMLTAKSELDDKVEGLDSGADDYLTKPFQVKELLARIRALTRRKAEIINVTSLGNVVFNSDNSTMSNGDKVVNLTKKEFSLMEYFLRNKNKYVTSEKIFDDVWSSDTDAYITVVWVFISTLRRKLASIDANIIIDAKRGNGYTLKEKDV